MGTRMREHRAGGALPGCGDGGPESQERTDGRPRKARSGGDEGGDGISRTGVGRLGRPGWRSTYQVVPGHPWDLPSLQMERSGGLK